MIYEITLYAHSDKESNFCMLSEFEQENDVRFDETFKRNLTYLNYEIPTTYLIDTEKKTAKLIKVYDVPIVSEAEKYG